MMTQMEALLVLVLVLVLVAVATPVICQSLHFVKKSFNCASAC
jgi:hypothetical protein